MNAMAAISKPKTQKDSIFKTNPRPSYFMNDVPSKMFVIHNGRMLFMKRTASPSVNTTISEDVLLALNSSEYVMD